MNLYDPAPRESALGSTASTYARVRQRRSGLSIMIGGALAVSGTSTAVLPPGREPVILLDSGTSAGVRLDLAVSAHQPASETTRRAIGELRRISGLTWDQLGQLFGVARRSVHYWASGEPLNARNEDRLRKVLDIVRAGDRGESRLTRSALLAVHEGTSAFELLVAGHFDKARDLLGTGTGRKRSLPGELSPDAKAARAPLPPEVLVEAMHDTVHRTPGQGRVARTLRNLQRGSN